MKFCLIGNPVAGSKSPVIHEKSFEWHRIDGTYELKQVHDEAFEAAIEEMKSGGYSGFNVTIPYKEAVLPLLDVIDPVAEAMGSVNTVHIVEGKLYGYNTDGLGFVRSIVSQGYSPEGQTILVMGAGGAARGICFALLAAGAKRIWICNRTLERADILAGELSQHFEDQEIFSINSLNVLEPLEFDDIQIVINTTSVGMTPNDSRSPVNPERFAPRVVFCDIVYKPHETKMLQLAKASGHPVVYGIDMLIWQALLAEGIWFGEDQMGVDKLLKTKKFLENCDI